MPLRKVTFYVKFKRSYKMKGIAYFIVKRGNVAEWNGVFERLEGW